METTTCPHCGQEHPAGTRFCPKNGLAIISSGNSICPSCGKAIEATWKICVYCGKDLSGNKVRVLEQPVISTVKAKKTNPILLFGMATLVVIVVIGLGALSLDGVKLDTSNDIPSIETNQNFSTNESVIPTVSQDHTNIRPTRAITTTTDLNETTSPTLAVASTKTLQTPCDASKWIIIPLFVKTYPSSQAGWKYVVMKYAIANESRSWGSLVHFVISSEYSYLVTENGFAYPPLDSFADYTSFEREMSEFGFEGFPNWPQPYFLFPDPVPPGFAITGVYPSYFSESYAIAFRVAETQSKFMLVTKEPAIMCRSSDGKITFSSKYSSGQNLIIDLEKDLSPISNPVSESNIRNISEPIDIPGFGTININGLSNSTDTPGLLLNMDFTNSSVGYQADGGIDSYLITSDGTVIRDEGGFSAGPGQSIEFSLFFEDAPLRDDYHIVFHDINDIPINLVYDLSSQKISEESLKTNEAELFTQSEYFFVYPGDVIRPYVIVQNSGTSIWGKGTYGYSGKGEWANKWGDGKLWRDVSPGEAIEFVDAEEIKAPTTPGTYQYGFMMTDENGKEFGPYFYIQVNVLSKPKNTNSTDLTLIMVKSVDPLEYKLKELTTPAGFLDLLVIHSGIVYAQLFQILTSADDIVTWPDKIEIAYYKDNRSQACFAQITEYQGQRITKQGDLLLIPCESAPIIS